jgi:hypothetical protein
MQSRVCGATVTDTDGGPEEPKRSDDLEATSIGRHRRIVARVWQIANGVRVTSRRVTRRLRGPPGARECRTPAAHWRFALITATKDNRERLDRNTPHGRPYARRLPTTSLDDGNWAARAVPIIAARRSSTSGAVSERADRRAVAAGHHGDRLLGHQGPGRDDAGDRPLPRMARLRRTGVYGNAVDG